MTCYKNFSRISKCPECSSFSYVEDLERGEIICQRCGLVINGGIINEGPEWRIFTNKEEKKRRRIGPPNYYSEYDKGLPTTIQDINRDIFGRQIKISTKLNMLKLKRWQNKKQSHMERNLFHAMIEIDRLTDILHIPIQVKESASVIYRKALAKGLVRGRSISGFAAAALYAACRISEIPRTLKEISANGGISVKYVFYCYRLLICELGLQMPIEDSIKCVSRIASKTQIPFKTQRIAIDILREAKKQGILSGKNPMGLAAATLYIACLLIRLEKTQNQIAKAANITEVTLRNRYREIKEKISLNFLPRKYYES